MRASSPRLDRLGAVAALLLGAALIATGGGACRRSAIPQGAPAAPGSIAPASEITLPVDLYFPGNDCLLHAERRELKATAEVREQVRRIVDTLLAGPESPALFRPLPEGVTLAAVYLSADGVAYLDLRSQEQALPLSDGSCGEMQAVFSLVDTVALNIPEARQVVLLWNGVQPQSFSGHLDTTRPLLPDTGLVAR